MLKFTFKAEHEDLRGNVDQTTTFETTELTWPELERQFIQFLRGCGFVIPAGYEDWERYAPEDEEPAGGCTADWDFEEDEEEETRPRIERLKAFLIGL